MLGLQNIKKDIPNLNSTKVLNDIVNRGCGFTILDDGRLTQKIKCPIESIWADILLQERGMDFKEYDGGENCCFSNSNTKDSLEIWHYNGGYDCSPDFTKHFLMWQRYETVQSLSNRVAIKLKSQGNCCWDIFDGVRFTGNRVRLERGYNGSPDIQPKSIRRTSC